MTFSAVFKKDLEKDVAGDTSGNFAKLLLALVQVGLHLSSQSKKHKNSDRFP